MIVFAERARRSESCRFPGVSTGFSSCCICVLDRQGCEGRQFQRDPAAAALEPGRGGRALEPLCGRRFFDHANRIA